MAVGAATRRTRAPTACDDVAPARGSRARRRRRCPDADADRGRTGTGCSPAPAGVRSCFRALPKTALEKGTTTLREASSSATSSSSSSSGDAGCCSTLGDSATTHRARRSTSEPIIAFSLEEQRRVFVGAFDPRINCPRAGTRRPSLASAGRPADERVSGVRDPVFH